MNKTPKCIYGHKCYSVCVNPECQMPAFMCQTGTKQFQQCGAFHENCQRIVWSEIQQVIKHNPRKKKQEFDLLQDKFDRLFYNSIKILHQQHQKFKTWLSTYGHNLEIMKFIKNINDENYKYVDGKCMDAMMTELFGSNNNRLIEAPTIFDQDLESHFEKMQQIIESTSSLYLRAHSSQNSLRTSVKTNKTNKTNTITDDKSSKPCYLKNHVDSLIVDQLSAINEYFDGKIKSLNLLYRASQNQFSTSQFHRKCDKTPNTLTLLKNQYGRILGGYTPLTWDATKKNWSPDKQKQTFIFSMDLKEKYNLNLPQFAIANNADRGPIFGCCDLFISNNADVQTSGCQFPISFNNGKYLRKSQTSEKLTGNLKGKYLVKEWQLFQVIFKTQIH